ncbi:unnamed protein product, partial [Cylindrotheca closterium]
KEVISDHNLTGKLTNSDLELEGTVLHHFVLGKTAQVEGETTYTGCDNTPAVSWRTKGSSTSRKAKARILRLAAGLQREQRAHHRIGHLSGTNNRMADDASRLWHLSDAKFISYFNRTYPQINSWQLYRMPNAVNSLMTSVLLNSESNAESVLQELQRHTLSGPHGLPSATASPLVSGRRSLAHHPPLWNPMAMWKNCPQNNRLSLDTAAEKLEERGSSSTMSTPIAKVLVKASIEACQKTHKYTHRNGNESIDVVGVFLFVTSWQISVKIGQAISFQVETSVFLYQRCRISWRRHSPSPPGQSLVTFAGLIFDKQKNAVPDEKIGLGTSLNGDNPTATLIAIVRHLRQS